MALDFKELMIPTYFYKASDGFCGHIPAYSSRRTHPGMFCRSRVDHTWRHCPQCTCLSSLAGPGADVCHVSGCSGHVVWCWSHVTRWGWASSLLSARRASRSCQCPQAPLAEESPQSGQRTWRTWWVGTPPDPRGTWWRPQWSPSRLASGFEVAEACLVCCREPGSERHRNTFSVHQ